MNKKFNISNFFNTYRIISMKVNEWRRTFLYPALLSCKYLQLLRSGSLIMSLPPSLSHVLFMLMHLLLLIAPCVLLLLPFFIFIFCNILNSSLFFRVIYLSSSLSGHFFLHPCLFQPQAFSFVLYCFLFYSFWILTFHVALTCYFVKKKMTNNFYFA